jgi:Ca2+-binding RTX toxin-like protein
MAVIKGTNDSDILKGSVGGIAGTLQDQIAGFAGDDIITGSNGDDEIEGGSGADLILGSGGNDMIYGGSGDDVIADGGGNDEVFAGEGNDTVIVDRGNDSLFGGKGYDTLDFTSAESGVKVDMHRGVASGDGTGTDTFKDFEIVVGSAHDDVIRGSDGDDVIIGGNGYNSIRGGKGSDTLVGGDDRDTYAWRTTDIIDAEGNSRGVDTVYGYSSGGDSLDLRELVASIRGLDDVDIPDNRSVLDDVIHLDETTEGTMLRVDFGNGQGFVDVALLADVYMGGDAKASVWSLDGAILV